MKLNFTFLDHWYEYIKNLARHKRAEPALAGISFIESSFFPLPPDLMLIPMVQAEPSKAWRYASVCALASILGGMLGYLIGWFFYESFALPILEKLGKVEKIEKFENMVSENGAMAVFGAGLTPFPYKVITIMSGALKLNFAVFVTASVMARCLRFFLVAGIVKKLGPGAEDFIKKHFAAVTFAIFFLILAAYLIWRLI